MAMYETLIYGQFSKWVPFRVPFIFRELHISLSATLLRLLGRFLLSSRGLFPIARRGRVGVESV